MQKKDDRGNGDTTSTEFNDSFISSLEGSIDLNVATQMVKDLMNPEQPGEIRDAAQLELETNIQSIPVQVAVLGSYSELLKNVDPSSEIASALVQFERSLGRSFDEQKNSPSYVNAFLRHQADRYEKVALMWMDKFQDLEVLKVVQATSEKLAAYRKELKDPELSPELEDQVKELEAAIFRAAREDSPYEDLIPPGGGLLADLAQVIDNAEGYLEKAGKQNLGTRESLKKVGPIDKSSHLGKLLDLFRSF